MSMTGFTRGLALLVLVGGTAVSAVAQEKMYNRGRHDVWVAFGQPRDTGLYTQFWTELKAGSFVVIPKEYAGYVRVVAVVGGKHYPVKPTRPLPAQMFPIRPTETADGAEAVLTGAFGNESAVVQAIEARGLRAAPFHPLAAYRSRDGAPVGVLATEAAQKDLDHATNVRALGVVALVNETTGPVQYKFRWMNGGQWNAMTLQPGKVHLWTEGYNPVRPEVEFAEGGSDNRSRVIPVRALDVRLNGAALKPRLEDAAQYRFVTTGDRVTLEAKIGPAAGPPATR